MAFVHLSFQLHGDHDFDEDDRDEDQGDTSWHEDDFDDADDILSDAVAMVSVHSLKKAASSAARSTSLQGSTS